MEKLNDNPFCVLEWHTDPSDYPIQEEGRKVIAAYHSKTNPNYIAFADIICYPCNQNKDYPFGIQPMDSFAYFAWAYIDYQNIMSYISEE